MNTQTQTDGKGRTWIKRDGKRYVARHGLDNQRIRFNWGYHDGAREAQTGPAVNTVPTTKFEGCMVRDMAYHHDRAYADGYYRGVEDMAHGHYTGSSAAQWERCGRTDDFNGWL